MKRMIRHSVEVKRMSNDLGQTEVWASRHDLAYSEQSRIVLPCSNKLLHGEHTRPVTHCGLDALNDPSPQRGLLLHRIIRATPTTLKMCVFDERKRWILQCPLPAGLN